MMLHHQHGIGTIRGLRTADAHLRFTSRTQAFKQHIKIPRARMAALKHAEGSRVATMDGTSVYVFTTPGCPYCKRAKQALGELKLDFKEVDVSVNQQLRAALKDVTGQSTVPQIYANGSLVGGSDALLAKITDGSFAQLLTHPSSSTILPPQLHSAMQAAVASSADSKAAAGPAFVSLPSDLQEVLNAMSNPATGISRQAAAAGSAPSFTGQAMLDWMVQHSSSRGSAINRAAAAATAEQLLAANAITMLADKQPSAAEVVIHDDAAHRYAVRSEAVRALPWGTALNTHFWWGPAAARPAEVVAEDLRGRILALYDKHLSGDGRAVDYKALKQDPEFWDYVDAAAELQRVDLSGISRAALMAFAINLYNALCIHTLVVHGPEQYNSTTGRIGFFQKAAKYNIGGQDYVLDALENGILRGNKPAASSIGMLLKLPWLSQGPFKESDPRRKHIVQPLDARIHFALVCGAKSCPPIKLYSADNIEEGLAGAAEAFCASEVAVDVPTKTVQMSKIFSWYYPDFGSDKAARLQFVLPYLPDDARAGLEQLLAADPKASHITVKYTPYDWTINAAE